MHYCTTCGHHHGQGSGWVKCIAVTKTETGGARRCTCQGPATDNQQRTQ